MRGSNDQAELKIAYRLKWLIGFFLCCLWGMLLVRGILIYRAQVNNLRQVLMQTSFAIEDMTRNQFRLAEMFLIAADEWLTGHPEADVLDEAFLKDFFPKFQKETGLFIGIYAIDSQGKLYNFVSSNKEALAFVHDREYFNISYETDIHISSPIKSRVSESWVIPFVLPLSVPRHEMRMLVIAMKVNVLNRLYERQRLKPNGSVFLFRKDGVLLTKTPWQPEFLGKTYAANIEKSFQNSKNETIVFSKSIFDNTTQLTSYMPLKEFPLAIMVSVPYRDILENVWGDLWIIVVWFSVATVAILLAGRQHIRLLAEHATLNAEILRMAAIDPLTGVLNRRRFIELMEHEFARSRRYETPLSLLMLDLDYFKQINDTYGHQMGDKILVTFSNTVTKNLRSIDFFARFGGEEFVVLLPQTGMEAAKQLAERICKVISQLQIPTEQGKISFSTSIGVTAIQETDTNPEEMIFRADRSLYTAKTNGRNQVGNIE